MAYLTTLLIVLQVLCAIAIIVLVLLQHGKGADMGAAFGSGASGSLFGASGSANFLSRSTGAVAAVFFIATLALAYSATSMRSVKAPQGGVMGTMLPNEPAKADAGKDEKKSAAPADENKAASKAADIPK
jgi:preprotein translocase subunit SecG